MSAREIQEQKAIAREMIVQQTAHAKADFSAGPLRGDTICSFKSRRVYTLESPAEDGFYELADTSLLPVTRVDACKPHPSLTPVGGYGKTTDATNHVQGKG